MWTNFSFNQFISHVNISHVLPPVPQSFYYSTGSTFIAAGVGATYGLIGRVIYPNTGISPLHYAVWFVLALQIKQFVETLENKFEKFLQEGDPLNDLSGLNEDELNLADLVRYHCWKVIHIKMKSLHIIDHIFSKAVNIRFFEDIDEDNVAEASFLEMCRYRAWPVFKAAVLDSLGFALAHNFSNTMGFTLPDRTALPLLIVIRSIVKDIILIPALYVYARFCNQVADKLGDDEKVASYRAAWLHQCLPKL